MIDYSIENYNFIECFDDQFDKILFDFYEAYLDQANEVFVRTAVNEEDLMCFLRKLKNLITLKIRLPSWFCESFFEKFSIHCPLIRSLILHVDKIYSLNKTFTQNLFII